MKYISKYIIHTNQTQCFEYSTEKFFSGQSEAGNSNASGTGSVRVSAQGLVSILQ